MTKYLFEYQNVICDDFSDIEELETDLELYNYLIELYDLHCHDIRVSIVREMKDIGSKEQLKKLVFQLKCKHVWKPTSEYGAFAICKTCNLESHFSPWFCPTSPDYRCHYSHNDDSCDYCHLPYERK